MTKDEVNCRSLIVDSDYCYYDVVIGSLFSDDNYYGDESYGITASSSNVSSNIKNHLKSELIRCRVN